MKTDYIVFMVNEDGAQSSMQTSEDLPEQPTYKELCAVVLPHLEGQELERVNVWYEDRYTDMFVGDCSSLLGLPRNEKATAIYRANSLKHFDPDEDPEDMPAIYGPAVLFLRKVWF